jgi:two-component system clock-associated histidine kinase SasA
LTPICYPVLKQDSMQAAAQKPPYRSATLQLVLFVDERPSSRKQIQQICSYLETLKAEYAFELQVVDVGEEPYLAEHFKLIATPALMKIHPEPRQTVAGSNLEVQLKNLWPRWQSSVEEYKAVLKERNEALSPQIAPASPEAGISSVAHSSKLIQLSDEIFRLKQEKEELIEQLQFKDRAIAMLAHDMRNPLTATSLALGTLELSHNNQSGRNSPLAPQVIDQLFKQARAQIRIIDRMIADILETSKRGNADLRILPRRMDIGVLCHNTISQLKEGFHAKSQRIETDIPNDLPLVYADEEQVRQLLVNLLDNAIKYTPEGGKILISILHRTSQNVQISVCDTGPGIPAEKCDRIFEDHFRLERDETKAGYGLGLSLCQQIVRAHYGHIWVDSYANKGSCFHFTLPVYR